MRLHGADVGGGLNPQAGAKAAGSQRLQRERRDVPGRAAVMSWPRRILRSGLIAVSPPPPSPTLNRGGRVLKFYPGLVSVHARSNRSKHRQERRGEARGDQAGGPDLHGSLAEMPIVVLSRWHSRTAGEGGRQTRRRRPGCPGHGESQAVRGEREGHLTQAGVCGRAEQFKRAINAVSEGSHSGPPDLGLWLALRVPGLSR